MCIDIPLSCKKKLYLLQYNTAKDFSDPLISEYTVEVYK